MNESQLFGVSIRGWLAVLTVMTLCVMAFMKIKVDEPFYTIVISIVSFYFGQKTGNTPKTNGQDPTKP